jgi:hypothetical protein
MSPQELLTAHGILLESTAPGRYYTTCPQCSRDRTGAAHQQAKVLGITIEGDSVRWGCNHCGWTGPEKGTTNSHQRQNHTAITHDYTSEDGSLLFQKVRNPPGANTRFYCRRPDGNGEWINNTKGIDHKPLYRWPEVAEAIAQDREIAVVEGESDVDALWEINIPATCNFDGAADITKNPNARPKWKAEYSQQLAGARLIVFNDHDPPGYAHAEAICRMSIGIVKRVRKLELAKHWPEIKKGGDIRDWLKAGHTREELDALIEAAPDYHAGDCQQPPERRKSEPPTVLSAAELKIMRFDPIKFVVPGYIVEGLSLLAGKPKIGKSWLLLHAAIAVARGGFTLGDIHCHEGDVLYCALEDNLRRLRSRMTKLLGEQAWPDRLKFVLEMPRLATGGVEFVKNWIEKAECPRLVIIDTLAMVKTPKTKVQTQYEADYDSVMELRRLANQCNVAIVLVHHLRKAEADDAFDTISGTLGLTGAPDTIMVIKRDTTGTITLHAKGRDLVEVEKAVKFNKDSCVWTVLGDASEVHRSNERATILEALAEVGSNPLGPNQIASACGMRAGNVRRLLGKMKTEGLVTSPSYGKYALPR